MTQRNCNIEGCINYGRYCRLHYPGDPAKITLPIKKVSDKRKETNKKEYEPVVKELKKGHKTCQIRSPVCIKTPVHSHHMKGRTGKLLSDKKFIIMACDPCNGYVETHSTWAKEMGFKLSKFN